MAIAIINNQFETSLTCLTVAPSHPANRYFSSLCLSLPAGSASLFRESFPTLPPVFDARPSSCHATVCIPE